MCQSGVFKVEFRKTKTKGMGLAHHNKHKLPGEPIKTRSKFNTCNQGQAQEIACDQVSFGFGVTSDWSRTQWREFFNQSQREYPHDTDLSWNETDQ